jgi:hypothetical protein
MVGASHVPHLEQNLELDLVTVTAVYVIQLLFLILQLSPVFARKPIHSSIHQAYASPVLTKLLMELDWSIIQQKPVPVSQLLSGMLN